MDAVLVCVQCVPSCLIVANICFPRISRIGRIKIQKWHLNPNVERFQRQRPFWWDGYWSRWDSTEIQRRLDPKRCSPNLPIFGDGGAPAQHHLPPQLLNPTPLTSFCAPHKGSFPHFFSFWVTYKLQDKYGLWECPKVKTKRMTIYNCSHDFDKLETKELRMKSSREDKWGTHMRRSQIGSWSAHLLSDQPDESTFLDERRNTLIHVGLSNLGKKEKVQIEEGEKEIVQKYFGWAKSRGRWI